jgi:hypothetical protein
MTLALVAAMMGSMVLATAAMGYMRPNLQTLKPYDLHVTNEGGRRLLRFSNEVSNNSGAVLEVHPYAGDDCDGDGDPNNDRRAYQRLYEDADGNNVFKRSIDKSYKQHYAGCMVFHPAHNHWHFQDFADYILKNESTGQVVASSTKVSFCMIDINRVFARNGSPNSPYFTRCGQDQTMGISVGWSDVYTWDLAGQDVDVTGLPTGYYCLISTANPKHRLYETNLADNTGRTRLQLTASGATPQSGACTSS